MRPEKLPTYSVEQMIHVEDIKILKAKYFRFVDGKQWDELEALFSPDVEVDYGIGSAGVFDSAAKLRGFLENWAEGLSTVHHGHTPEINLTDSFRATGVWAMADYVTPTHRPGLAFRGYGHYFETYERSDGGAWRIRSMQLTRLRVDRFVSDGAVSTDGDEESLR